MNSSRSTGRRRWWLSAPALLAGAALAVTAGQLGSAIQGTAPAAASAPAAQSSPAQSGASASPPRTDAYGDRGDLFVLTAGQRLYRLDRSGKGRPELNVAITGLAANERLVGIDTRPANGQLYAVGSTSRLYVIDPATGAASPVGPAFSTALDGKRFGVDFNPAVDRLRIVSDTGQNLRIDPTTGALAGVDTALAYHSADSATGMAPGVTAAAYTNSVAGAASTALYDIDTARDVLVLQGTKPGATPAVSPNTGRLFTVGRLGIDVADLNGFDIVGAAKGAAFDATDYRALAAVRVKAQQRSVLVRIDLRSGKASLRAKLPGSAVGLTASAGPAATLYATTAGNELVRFDRSRPGAVAGRAPITGLQPNESVVGIDFRPANGRLYLLGSGSQLYTVDPATAVATAGGTPFTPSVAGSLVGFDVNPVADRIRVVTTAGQNLRLNPDTGAVAGSAIADAPLTFAADDGNAPFRANVGHAAYTNNRVGAASTTLNDIDAALDVLATQQPPNDGTLRTAGRLRVNGDGRGGFDIAADGAALAALIPAGSDDSRLYSVDLGSGRARSLGRIGGGLTVTGLAIAPRGVGAGS